ncbi:MAG: CHAD domain-containing protein [Aestuariibacter sp.]
MMLNSRVKPVPQWQPHTATGQVVKLLATTMLNLSQQHEEGFLRHPEETEHLHNYRVVLRKARSVISLLKEAFPVDVQRQLRKRLAEMMRPTNRLRDLDVYLQKQNTLTRLLPNYLSVGLPIMFADFEQEQKQQIRQLNQRFRSRSYQLEREALRNILNNLHQDQMAPQAQESIQPVVCNLIGKSYQKVCKTGADITSSATDKELHNLRLQCKKLRYLLDLFSEILPEKPCINVLKKLKSLQTVLGDFNDYAVQQKTLRHYLSEAKDITQLHMSVGALIMALLQKQQQTSESVKASLNHFANKKTGHQIKRIILPTPII